MTDFDEIQRIERRTRRYWFEDGISEIGIGAVFILLALYFLAWGFLEAAGRAAPVLSVLLPVLILGSIIGVNRLVRAAKDRYVHPRTGYLSFPKPSNLRRASSALLAALISMAIVFVLARLPEGAPWIPAAQGILFALVFGYAGRQAGLLRFSILGVASAGLGVALSWWRVPDEWAAAILFGGTGLSLATSGAIAFARYARRRAGGEA